MASADLESLITERRIIICVGSGGVGKTTTAAALALAAARAGRKALVLTIDPARRLANSLGLDTLDHTERRIADDKIAAPGASGESPGMELATAPVTGSLHAMMLDQKQAFDEIVAEYATDPAQRARILGNRIYQQISSTLTGAHEYAAMAKLYALVREGRYDLIVLDTPPTANALDFLDSPEKVAAAIDSPALQWLIKPYLETGHFSLKLVGIGGAFILKQIAKFVGSRFLEDMAQFVAEFNTVLGGFRERAKAVGELLRKPEVAFVLVSGPDTLSVEEAVSFHRRLRDQSLPLGGFVVNRIHPPGPAAPDRAALLELLEGRPELRGYAPDDLVQVASDLDRTYRDFQSLAAMDAASVARLRAVAGSAPLVEVPLFDHDIHDMDGLSLIGRYLVV